MSKQLDLEHEYDPKTGEVLDDVTARKERNFYEPHVRVRTPVGEVSMTRQEFKDECDLNVLMARYEKAGANPVMANAVPRYLDLADVPDFQEAMNLVIEAQRAFMSLPAVVRREFDNDPGKFVEFAEREENLPKLREWGLAAPEKTPDAPLRVEVVNSTASPAKPTQ